MPTGTKIIIAVIVALFGSVVIYFAFVSPAATPDTGKSSVPGVSPKPSAPPAGAGRTEAPIVNPPRPNAPAPAPVTPPALSGNTEPRPAVSDPMTPVGKDARDPNRPAVDPNAPKQSGGKGDGSAAPGSGPGTTPGLGAGSGTSPTPGTNANPSSVPTNPVANPAGGGTNPPAPPTNAPKPNDPQPVKPQNPGPKPADGGPTPVKPATPPSTPSADGKREHVVANGETMSVIAEKYYGDKNKWELIAKANPLIDPARMAIGMKLVIPAKPADAKPAPANTPAGTPPTAGSGQTSHTVAAGETLISLSRKYYGKDSHWELIYDANRKVIGDDPAELKVGMKLVIPAKPAESKAESKTESKPKPSA